MRYHCSAVIDSGANVRADQFEAIDAPDVHSAALACLRRANRTLIELLDADVPVYVIVAESAHVRPNGIPTFGVTVEFRKAHDGGIPLEAVAESESCA